VDDRWAVLAAQDLDRGYLRVADAIVAVADGLSVAWVVLLLGRGQLGGTREIEQFGLIPHEFSVLARTL
jgi:hypothetical protein